MRRRGVVAIALAAVVGIAVVLTIVRARDDAPRTGDRLLVAFGDSVAAGQGLGPALGHPNNPRAFPALVGATLGWTVHNFAVSSACAATAGTRDAHPRTPEGCTTSILQDQLPRADQVVRGSPRLVLVTVGANDIRFADCGVEALVPASEAQPEEGPCDEEALTGRLAALEANLERVLFEVGRKYPRAEIVVTTYYNPMPPPPRTGEVPCEIFEPLAAARSPLSLVSEASLRSAASALQRETFTRFRDGVARLNESIARVAVAAEATLARVDFAGHDLCGSASGAQQDTWVYGPDYDVRFSVTGAAIAIKGKEWRGTLPSRCPSPTPERGPVFDTGETTRRIGVVRITYRARVDVNCMPHPTASGQRAIADAVLAARDEE